MNILNRTGSLLLASISVIGGFKTKNTYAVSTDTCSTQPSCSESSFELNKIITSDVMVRAEVLPSSDEHVLDKEVDMKQGLAEPVKPQAQTPFLKTLYFIDAAVGDVETLICALPAQDDVVLLNSSEDGFVQMASYLNGRHDIDVMHIVSRSPRGALRAGSSCLTPRNLVSYGALLTSIGQSLSTGGNILIYGCDIGVSKESRLISELELLTGAEVVIKADTVDLD